MTENGVLLLLCCLIVGWFGVVLLTLCLFCRSVVGLSSFCDFCYKEFDAFSYHNCDDVVTTKNNTLPMRHSNVRQAENDDEVLVIDMTLDSDSDEFPADIERDLHVTEDADYNLINGKLVDLTKSDGNEIVTLESSPKTKETENETGPCKSDKIAFTEISAPIIQGTLIKPQNSYMFKNDVGLIIHSNTKVVDGRTPKKLNKSKAHGLNAKRFRATNGLSATKTFTNQNSSESSEKALPIQEGWKKPQSRKCPGNVYSHAKMIDVILPKIIPEEKAFTGDKNNENNLGIKEILNGMEKMSGEKHKKNYLRAIKDSGTMKKQYLSNDKSSKALDELPNRETNDMKTNKAGAKFKNPNVMLNTKKHTKNRGKSFAKNKKFKSPTQNPIGHQKSLSQTTVITEEVAPVGSAEVTKVTRHESIGGTKNSSNLQTMTAIKENQESKSSRNSRKRNRKRKKFTKTPIPIKGAETSSSKPISETLQGDSLPLVKGNGPLVRKSNFSTQKKLEKSSEIFMCTLCECYFKLKGDVMIHYIMRHHCEAPESSLLSVKTKKSTMGPGKNLPDVALKTNKGYIQCEKRGSKVDVSPMMKLKQQKTVTLQQYKENRTFFNSKYDSDSSGSSTCLENLKKKNFKAGAAQEKAKEVLTLQQYKTMKSSDFKCSLDSDYCSSSTGITVGVQENLNQSALQETRVATFSPEPSSEEDFLHRASPSYCEVCGLQIDNSSSLAYHMKIVHPGFALKCFVCGTSCGNFDSLIKHHRKHSEFQISIGENQFLRTRKSGPNQPYPYYCTFCGVGFTLIKMLLAHKLNLQCRGKKTGQVESNDVAGDRDGVEKDYVAGVPDEVEKSNLPDIANEVEKNNIADDLDGVEEDDLSDEPQLTIDEAAVGKDSGSEQKTIDDAAEAGAREVLARDAQLNTTYSCCKCKAKFERLGNLTLHIIRECFTKSTPTFESSTSTKMTKQELERRETLLPSGSDTLDMENHNYIYSNQTPSLVCSYCNKSFFYYFDLKRHKSQWCQPYEEFKKAHKGLSLTQKNICKCCSLKFKNRAALKSHMMIYCKLFKKRCNSLNKGKFKGKRVKYARSMLGKKRKSVKSGSKLQRENAFLKSGNDNEDIHSEVIQGQYKSSNERVDEGSVKKSCEICKCIFKYETDLIVHRFKGCAQSKAPDSKTCQVCGLKCLYESDLAIHVRNAHSGATTSKHHNSDKFEPVNYEGMSRATSESVKEDKKNQKTPSKSTKFNCPYCNLSFNSQSDVSTHKMLYCMSSIKTNSLAKDCQDGKVGEAKSSDEAIDRAKQAKSSIDSQNHQGNIKEASSSSSMTNHACYICGSRFCSDLALKRHQSKYCKIFYPSRKESKSAHNAKEKSVNTSKINDENPRVAIETNKGDEKAAEEARIKKFNEKAFVGLETNKNNDKAAKGAEIKKHDEKGLDTPKTNEAASIKLTIADTEEEITKDAEVKALPESAQSNDASTEKAFKRQKSLIIAPEIDPYEKENICNICGYRFEYSAALQRHKALYCKVFNTSDPQKTTKTNINELAKFEEEKYYQLSDQEDEQYGTFDLRDTLRRKAEFKKSTLYRRGGNEKYDEEDLKSGKGPSYPAAVKDHRTSKNWGQHDSRFQGLEVDSVTTLPPFEETSFDEFPLPDHRSNEKHYFRRSSSPELFLSQNKRSRSPLEKRFEYLKYKPHSNSRCYSTSPPSRHQLESYRGRRECSISPRHYSVSPSRKLKPRRYSSDHIPRRSYSSPRTIPIRKSNSPSSRSQQRRYSPDIPTKTRSTSISPHRRTESFSRHYSSTSNVNAAGQSHVVRRYNKVAPKAKAIYCEKCGDSIRSYQELLRPRCKHYKNIFPCTVCNLKFPDLNTLILHQDHAHKSEDVTFKELAKSVKEIRYYCCACGMGFNFITNLISHKILHHKFIQPNSSSTPAIRSADPYIRGYACRVCDNRVFSNLELLQKHEQFSDNHKRQLEDFGHMTTDYVPVKHDKFEHICYVCQLGFLTFRDLQIHMLESSAHFLNESKSEEGSSKTTNYRHEQHSNRRVLSVRNPEQSRSRHKVTSQQTPITPEPKSSSIKGSSSDKLSSASNDSDVLPTKTTSAPEYHVAYVMPSEGVEGEVTHEDGEEPFKRYVYDMLALKFETREYICDYCSQYFEKYRQLAYHLRTKHKSQDEFACPTCAKTFKTRSRLSRHCEQCLGPSSKGTFQCHTCDKVLCSKQALVTHTKRHSRVYDIKCEFCGKGFFSNSSLRLHVNSRHTGKSRFVCDICSRSCYDKTALKNHMEKHEPGYKLRSKVKCPQCEQEFLDKKYLKIHLSKKHGTDSKFICDLCGKELYSKSGLKDHMNIHQGLKPHKCELCGEGFANSTTLRLHCRRHTGERPYKCTMCDKAFTQSHTLKVHVRKHTGEKPYSCNICDRGFVSSSILRSHMKGTHRTD